MNLRAPHVSQVRAASYVARLHDGTGAVALGVGLLRSGSPGALKALHEPLEMLEQALISLKRLEADMTQSKRAPELDLLVWLRQRADLLGLELDLRVTGSAERLGPGLVELLCLAGDEALLNVRRHAGTRACRIELDLSSCPFIFRARDWGAGVTAGSKGGHGLALLGELADWLGCQLVVASQPRLGTELVIHGERGCPSREPNLTAFERGGGPVRKSLSSRS